MLKRLELVGFKSFADKTVFDFDDGITAIVGPNGSGKSNIVDAVRWILGEQSAKTLRGGEMADVIFNGSTSRRSLGLAEVTMIFDNRKRQLPVDAEEVQITRRVYRTGEGEYLLNGAVCRLKDQRDLFLGSGLGNDDFCIIAQGKVDVLLHASAKERRTILEEAAGISRFKAKKLEALRKLERVEQNLQRVRDIVDEVEKQLRSVKLQASKAQRFQEYSVRLRELRVAVGLDEFGRQQERLREAQATLERLRVELDQEAARAGACEAEAERIEFQLADLDDALREQEAALAEAVQRIKTHQAVQAREQTLSADVDAELTKTRARLASLGGQVGALESAERDAAQELEQAEAQALGRRQAVHGLVASLHEVESDLARVQEQAARDQAEHLETMRRAAHLQNEAVAGKAQVDNLRRERERLMHRSTQAAESLASVDGELQSLVEADASLQERLADARRQLASLRTQRDDERVAAERCRDALAQARQQREALASRADVLQGLVRGHEGLSVGVREVFSLLETPDPGPWRAVLGMVADFLTVKREAAPLIDLALGDVAQRFLVRDLDRFAEALAARAEPFAGRVSFLPLAGPSAAPMTVTHPGLVAPAEQVVSCDHPDLLDLPTRLLGRTFLMRDLASAREAAAQTPGGRFVTLAGELLDADGTLTVGKTAGDVGILARKSELAELLSQVSQRDRTIAEREAEWSRRRDEAIRLDRTLREREEEAGVLAEQAADLRGRVERHRDRRQGLHDEVAVQQDELQRTESAIESSETRWRTASEQATVAEAQVRELLDQLHAAEDESRRFEAHRARQQSVCTQAQVELATHEERLSALRARHHQLARDRAARAAEETQGRDAVATAQRRLVESQQAMLNASAVLAHAFLDKETLQGSAADLVRRRDSRRVERARLAQQAQTVRTEWRTRQEQFHQRELEVNDLRHESDTLCQRLRDDYQIELPDLFRARPAVPAEGETPLDVGAAHDEIAELRKKLAKLGSVNMDALREMEDLERRSAEIQAQLDDLAQAKKSLDEIIGKINQDSRRLFLETFQSVRTHFQELFRKLFGGGMADLALEDDADVLESGLDIVARPPGKELRSISLMSGGEKTLTAVALLLAVFRSKPAPFCLLDEVDAALDEANIGRFTAVLRDFTDQSQFILVTHSKKTMAVADVLYGITMQESGVSKQVAVRFEDWVDPEEPEKGVA